MGAARSQCCCTDGAVVKEGTTIDGTNDGRQSQYYVSKPAGGTNAEVRSVKAIATIENDKATISSSRSKGDSPRRQASEKGSVEKKSDVASDTDVYLSLTFKVPETDAFEEVKLHYRPLGINFGKKVPVTVKSVEEDSSGSLAGVRSGWQLWRINTEDVASEEFTNIVERLKEETKPLRDIRKKGKSGSRSKAASKSDSRSARSGGS